MVLSRWMIGLGLVGCVPHTTAVQAPEATVVAVAGVVDQPDQRAVSELPLSVRNRLAKVMAQRNLTPRVVDAESFGLPFAARRASSWRLTWLAQHADGASLVLLVEAHAEFFSQLGGRYRWTVHVTLSAAPTAHPDQAVTSTFEVPAFLLYHHEREPEAIEAASPVIERQAGYLLDEVLGGA